MKIILSILLLVIFSVVLGIAVTSSHTGCKNPQGCEVTYCIESEWFPLTGNLALDTHCVKWETKIVYPKKEVK